MSSPVRLNIAMVAACPFPTSQGSQVLIRELSEALVRRGHRLHVVTYHFGEPLECPGLIIHRIPELFRYNKFRSGPEIRKPILDLLLVRKLDQVVRREKIHVIHAHNYEAPLAAWPVCRRYRLPLVYHSHNTMSDEFYTYFRLKIPQTMARAAAHLMDRFIPRQADFIIAINPRVADFLIEMGTVAAKVKYIPPGVDFGAPVERPDPRVALRFNLGNGPLMLYVGNLDGYQRLDLLLDALPHVLKMHPRVRLVILTGSSISSLQDEIHRRNLTSSIICIQNLPFNLVKQVLALGSLAVNSRMSWSGFPIKVLNYMAAGLPVVAFRGAAAPVVDGVTGFLASPGDAHSFAQAMISLLDDPAVARRMGAEGRRQVQRDYSWEAIAAQIERIYGRLLGLPQSAPRPSLLTSAAARLSISQVSA